MKIIDERERQKNKDRMEQRGDVNYSKSVSNKLNQNKIKLLIRLKVKLSKTSEIKQERISDTSKFQKINKDPTRSFTTTFFT